MTGQRPSARFGGYWWAGPDARPVRVRSPTITGRAIAGSGFDARSLLPDFHEREWPLAAGVVEHESEVGARQGLADIRLRTRESVTNLVERNRMPAVADPLSDTQRGVGGRRDPDEDHDEHVACGASLPKEADFFTHGI